MPGKSTLMKVLFGMLPPDAGTIIFRGRELFRHHPREAMAAGIAIIHQHFMLIEAMTVVENVMLGWRGALSEPPPSRRRCGKQTGVSVSTSTLPRSSPRCRWAAGNASRNPQGNPARCRTPDPR